MANKYNLAGVINEKFSKISNTIYSKLREILENKNDAEFVRKFLVLLSALSILNLQKQGEKIISEILIKPHLDAIFKTLVQYRTNVVSATKKEYLEKSNLQK